MPHKDPETRKAYQRRYQRRYYHLKAKALIDPEARRAYMKKYRAMNLATLSEKQRDSERRRLYGLSPAQYQALMRSQGSECPICMRFLATHVRPSVDHSHATGAVRGVLCRKCNAALGMLEDSPANLERAIEYLSARHLMSVRKLLSGAISTTSSEP